MYYYSIFGQCLQGYDNLIIAGFIQHLNRIKVPIKANVLTEPLIR